MRTRACDLLGIEHPLVLGGMAGVAASRLVAAVSNAGALGTLGCANQPAAWIGPAVREIREKTDRPFALNLLLFLADEAAIAELAQVFLQSQYDIRAVMRTLFMSDFSQ